MKSNSLFLQRIAAYLIDVILITMIAMLVTMPISNGDNASLQKLSNAQNEILNKYNKKQISIKTYAIDTERVSYQIGRKVGISTLIQLLIAILYFVVFQFYYGGQTVGKKLLKIKVINNDERKKLTMNNIIIRALIINSILYNMIDFSFVILTTENVYSYSAIVLQGIQTLAFIISVFMIMYRKDGRGLHDLVADTKVVRVDAVKENELCES